MKNEDFNKNWQNLFSEYKKFLSFRSISSSREHDDDSKACAAWLKGFLEKIGFSAQLIDTPTLPLVFAEFDSKKPGKTVLYYGHYDVQPTDPFELWKTDPFEATEHDERIYARGAQDNKGQTMYVLQAMRSLIEEGKITGKIKILIEGEEESGSKSLIPTLPKIKDLLKADCLLVCDTGTLDESKGALTLGLRGIAHLEVSLTGPSKDLHSGVHGGVSPNPAIGISHLIASLHDENGKVAVPFFYDGVSEPNPVDLNKANLFPLTETIYQHMTGVLPTGGEKNRGLIERRGFRPTVEVNGITSGHQGEGSKTIIPSKASVKLSMRLVHGQDPATILHLVIDHLRMKTPFGLKFEVIEQMASGKALLVSAENEWAKKAEAALTKVTESAPIYIWEGASIPILTSLAEASGSTPVLVGFGLEEDNIHAPNESFKISQYRKGFFFVREFLGGF